MRDHKDVPQQQQMDSWVRVGDLGTASSLKKSLFYFS